MTATDPVGALRKLWADTHVHDADFPLAAKHVRGSLEISAQDDPTLMRVIEELKAQDSAAVGRMRTAFVLAQYRDGDEMGWPAEFAWLDLHQGQVLWTLAVDIRANGMQTPIRLGNDGRVWDGHHRLRVAVILGLDEVPVEVVR